VNARTYQTFCWLGLFSVVLRWTPAAAVVLNVGDKAPSFSLIGADGKPHALADFKKRVVVLEWYNRDCPFVKKFYSAGRMQKWQAEQTAGDDGVVWLTITSSAAGKQGFLTPPEALKVREESGMKSTMLLLDSKGAVGRLYGTKTTPQVFVIDKKGRVAYKGAVDDRPSAQPVSLEGAQDYFIEALTAVRRKANVRTPSTTPYGCAVKYM